MWDDEELDERTEAREAMEEAELFEQHNAYHDAAEAPVEDCSFCEEEVAELEMDARAEAEDMNEAA